MDSEKAAVRTTYFSIVGNTSLAVIKWMVGYLGNSFAMIADAIESTTDIFSSIFVLLGIKYANKPADKNHPYGHGKAEPLVTFLIVAFLVTSAFTIAYHSIQNIGVPHELPEPYTLVVLGAIIVWKEASYRWVAHTSKQLNSTTLKADAWHHRSDAITSLAAFIGISFALIMGKGYESADDWAALLASFFILYNSYLIFRPALGEVMDEHVHHDIEERIRTLAMTVKGIYNTEKCHIRKTGMVLHADLHIIVDGDLKVKEGHDIAHRLKDVLKAAIPELANVLIHVEPYNKAT